MAWAAIWQDGRAQPLGGFTAHRGGDDARLQVLSLWFEIAMPAFRRRPVRLWQGRDAGGIEVYVMPGGALRVLHGADVDMSTAPGFIGPGQVLVLRIVASADGRGDIVEAWNADTRMRRVLHANIARDLRLGHALPGDAGFVETAHHAAIATHAIPSGHLPGIESGAMIATPTGPTAIEDLHIGATVLDAGGQGHTVRWIDMRERLCLGRMAPVLLRAPYFGIERDICVTPQTRLVRHGPEVEYLSGTDAVLVRAADLVLGPGARHDRARPLRRFHHILLDDPACLLVDRCRIETPFLSEVLSCNDAPSTAARPEAKDSEPSLPLLDRVSARSLAPHGPTAQNFTL